MSLWCLLCISLKLPIKYFHTQRADFVVKYIYSSLWCRKKKKSEQSYNMNSYSIFEDAYDEHDNACTNICAYKKKHLFISSNLIQLNYYLFVLFFFGSTQKIRVASPFWPSILLLIFFFEINLMKQSESVDEQYSCGCVRSS